MVKFTFKPFKSPKSPAGLWLYREHMYRILNDVYILDSASAEQPQNPYQKRREQVRRAQKTHRERKEAYVKSLETEVIQLRANEARLFQETKSLYTEINAMKTLLARHGIPIPSNITSPIRDQGNNGAERWGSDAGSSKAGEGIYEFSVTEVTTKQPQERIAVRRQTRKRSNGRNNAGSNANFSLPLPVSSPSTVDSVPSSSPSSLVSAQDPTAIGMDFILALEAPCLSHIPHTHAPPEESSGHALMASATLLHFHTPHDHSHNHPPSTTTTPSTASPTWTVPESGVQRLLALAQSIPLDGEVTPVQAWACIRQHAEYAQLRLDRLEEVKRGLLGWVKCYGFGGVVPQDVFEMAVRDLYA